jgi:hypothetical protein
MRPDTRACRYIGAAGVAKHLAVLVAALFRAGVSRGWPPPRRRQSLRTRAQQSDLRQRAGAKVFLRSRGATSAKACGRCPGLL